MSERGKRTPTSLAPPSSWMRMAATACSRLVNTAACFLTRSSRSGNSGSVEPVSIWMCESRPPTFSCSASS